MKLMTDPDFLDAVKKRNLEAEPSTGEELEKIAKEVMTQPPEVIERVKNSWGNEVEGLIAPCGKLTKSKFNRWESG